MGYDDDECIYCYSQEGGNNPCEGNNVCGICVDLLLKDRDYSSRFYNGFVTHLGDNYGTGSSTKCHLCCRTRHLIFNSPCCDSHKGAFEFKEDYESEFSDESSE